MIPYGFVTNPGEPAQLFSGINGTEHFQFSMWAEG